MRLKKWRISRTGICIHPNSPHNNWRTWRHKWGWPGCGKWRQPWQRAKCVWVGKNVLKHWKGACVSSLSVLGQQMFSNNSHKNLRIFSALSLQYRAKPKIWGFWARRRRKPWKLMHGGCSIAKNIWIFSMLSKRRRKTSETNARWLQHHTHKTWILGIFSILCRERQKTLEIATRMWHHRTQLWQVDHYHVEGEPKVLGYCPHEQAEVLHGRTDFNHNTRGQTELPRVFLPT